MEEQQLKKDFPVGSLVRLSVSILDDDTWVLERKVTSKALGVVSGLKEYNNGWYVLVYWNKRVFIWQPEAYSLNEQTLTSMKRKEIELVAKPHITV